MNEYEPDNELQKLYSSLSTNCLCGHGEFCRRCDGTDAKLKKEIVNIAKLKGYQLYYFIDHKNIAPVVYSNEK